MTPIVGPITADRLVNGFFQGSRGNCASIAAIKAGIFACWPDPVFTQITTHGDDIRVVTRDETTPSIVITPGDLLLARTAAGLKGDDESLRTHAEFMFAVMAKTFALEQRTPTPFQDSLDALNAGYDFSDAPGFLGLDAWVCVGPGAGRPRRRKDFLAKHGAAMAAKIHHAWFVSHGQHDVYGDEDFRERCTSTLALVRPT